MDQVLETVVAKLEITEQLHNYCRAMDRIDDDLGRSVFHPEAEADYGTMFSGTGYGFIDFVHASHSGMLVQSHNLSNISIRVDGDKAGSESYVVATLRMKGEGDTVMQIHSLGRYIDDWERRDGSWRIARRHYVHTMDEIRPIAMSMYATGGARDRTDPSYEKLGTIDGLVAA